VALIIANILIVGHLKKKKQAEFKI